MSNILKLRREIESINNKYADEIAEYKIKIAELESQKQYDAACSMLIDEYESGEYVKEPGVTIKTLKTITITDESKVPDKYLKTVVDDKKIKADIKESAYTKNIPGVNVGVKYSVAVSLK